MTFEGEGLAADAPKEQTFDRVLVSVGRRPNSAVPGLDKTEVKVNERGFIEVDAARRTAEPSIFAIGDVVGEPMLAHKASHEGRVAVEAIAGREGRVRAAGDSGRRLHRSGARLVRADRERGAEAEREVTVARFPWAASGRALTLDRPDGMTKLIIDPKTERILGVGIVGPGAGELIAEGVLAVEMGANATDLKMTIHRTRRCPRR